MKEENLSFINNYKIRRTLVLLIITKLGTVNFCSKLKRFDFDIMQKQKAYGLIMIPVYGPFASR